MNFIKACISGMTSMFSINASPLYRYPYRSAAEAFAGDWKKIGEDVKHSLKMQGGDHE